MSSHFCLVSPLKGGLEKRSNVELEREVVRLSREKAKALGREEFFSL